jgi:glycosyltransferase involved in cell wall biosynthesis
MKRIVFVHPAIRSYRAELFERLAKHGIEYLFSSINDVDTPAGIETRRILEKTAIKYHQCREFQLFGRKNFSFDLWRVLKYEIVIFSCATSIPFLLLALPLKIVGKKVILFDEMWKYPEKIFVYDILRPIIRLLVKRTVAGYVAAGSKAAQYMREEYSAVDKKMQIAFNTTSIDLTSQKKLKYSQHFLNLKKEIDCLGRPVVLYLGRLVRYKGLDILIKAVSYLDIRVTLLVVGDGPYRQECEKLIDSCGMNEDTIFWGACDIDEASCFYELADIFVLPTRFLQGEPVGYESWGFTINEAMAFGLPVLASDAVGSAYDLIRHMETGMFFKSEDIQDLQRVLRRVLSDQELMRSIGINGKDYVHRKCSYEQNEIAFKAVIDSMS